MGYSTALIGVDSCIFRLLTTSGKIGKLEVPELSGLQRAKRNIRLFLGAL